MSQLNQYESLLLQYDPDFLPEHLYESMSSPTNTLIHLLTRGMYPPWDPTDIAQSYQLHVNVERVRVPEVLFQPNIIGLDQAGLIETVNDIVKTFDVNQRQKIMQVREIYEEYYPFFFNCLLYRIYSLRVAIVKCLVYLIEFMHHYNPFIL